MMLSRLLAESNCQWKVTSPSALAQMPISAMRKSPVCAGLFRAPDEKATEPAGPNPQGLGPLHTWFKATVSNDVRSGVRVLAGVHVEPTGLTTCTSELV